MPCRARFFILATATAAVLACGGAEPEATPPRAVRIETVAAHVAPGGSRYSANIEPRERVVAAFRVGGYVDSIARRRGIDGRQRHLQQGDAVARGEILARLRDVEYRAKVEQAQSAVGEARARLGKARLDMERATRLYETRSLTKPEYDAAKASVEAAEAAAAGAEGRLREAGQALEDCALRSPLAGVVLGRSLEAGQLVGSGSAAFIVADVSSAKAVFGVPDRVVRELKLGDGLSVRIEVPGSGIFRGMVTAIAPAADVQSRVFPVEVTMENASGELKPGMIASVEVGGGGEETGVPSVPLSAVIKADAGGYALFVVENRNGGLIARARPVELGGIRGNRIAVQGGVRVGERIVSSGATLLVDGEAVRIIP